MYRTLHKRLYCSLSLWLLGGEIGEWIVRELGMDMYTLLYLKWRTKLCGSLGGRRVWERMDPCICMVESLHCFPETITTFFVN